MRTLIIALSLLSAGAKQTESIDGVHYPDAYEVECFTDACLGELTQQYDGNPY